MSGRSAAGSRHKAACGDAVASEPNDGLGDRRRTHRKRWRIHRLLLWSGSFAAALTFIFGFLLWRLMQGPIDLDRLTPFVQQLLNRSGGGMQVVISGARLGIDRATHQLDLRLKGVRLTQPDGQPLATLPDLSASFSLRSILLGSMAPTRIVIERPVVRVVRDEAGAVRFGFGDQGTEGPSLTPEILEGLGAPLKPNAPFALLRRFVIRDATLVLDDRQTGRRWQANRVDTSIKREFTGFAGDLSLALPIGSSRPEFHARFRYVAGQRTLDLVLEMGAVEPAALAPLSPELAPLTLANFLVSGTLATRLNLAGATQEGVRLDLYFGKGSIRSDLLPEGSIALQQGLLRAVYAPESNELRLAKLDFDLGGGSALTVTGNLEGITSAMIAGADPAPSSLRGKLGIVLSDVPVAKFESLWPPGLSRGGRRWVLANVHDGVLDLAAVQLDLEVDPATRSAEVVSAHGTMRYHNATISYFQRLEPARKVSGTATLNDKRLVFTPTSGSVKSVHITGGALQITDLGAPVEWLTVDLTAAGPIQDVLEIINAKPLRYAHDIGLDPAQVAGQTEANLHFKLPLLQALKLAQIQYGVKAKLTGAAITDVAMNRNLTDGDFALEITHPGAHLRGTSRFDGVPLTIDANLFFKPSEGARARYRVGLTLDDEQRHRLALDFLPGRVAGPVGIDLTYWAIDTAHAEAEALVDLRTAALSVAEAGWRKPPGAPATARLHLDLSNDKITRLREIEAKAAGLYGKFALAFEPGTDRINRVDIYRLVLPNDDVAGSVARRREGGWHLDLHGPILDLSHWIKDLGKGSQQQAIAEAPLQIDAQLGRVMLGPQRELHDVAARLLLAGTDWRTAQIGAQFPNGHQLSLQFGKEWGKRSLTFRSADLGETLRLLHVSDNILGGKVTIAGQVSELDGREVIGGHIEGQDYSLIRAPVFARILSLPSFSGVGSMLAGSGIPFSTLRGDFAYRDNHLKLENILAYGGAIGVTGNGVVDVGRDRLDLQGTIVPAYALNSIIGNIPVIGSLLVGGEGQGLFAANYHVTGSGADPQVSVNPLSALAPGFLRRLFQPNFGRSPPVQ